MEVVPPHSYPREKGSPVESFPIQGSKTTPFFPPVCLKSHWDPTMIYNRTVPAQHVALPTDFRPYTKVCLQYTTSGPAEALPYVPDNLVFPMGGEFYPPQRWSNNINDDSLTKRLDRPLKKYCDIGEYIPPQQGDMYNQRLVVPQRRTPSTRFVEELAMPKVLLRTAPYDCREKVDNFNWDASQRLFNNPTKQDRYRKDQVANYSIWKHKDVRCAENDVPRVTTLPVAFQEAIPLRLVGDHPIVYYASSSGQTQKA